MNKVANGDMLSQMNGSFLEEYRSPASIKKYTKPTAGYGINYLLEKEYGDIYLKMLEENVPASKRRTGVRLLEFGCGGGMNLLHLVSKLTRHGIAIDRAYGTDFSDKLIEAANQEAAFQLTPDQRQKVQFCVAKNESLLPDMVAGMGVSDRSLLGTFDLIVGVNTIRYCHRLNKEIECAQGIQDLLTEGGICVVIDMNSKFPLFRSRLPDRLTLDERAYFLPSTKEYARPFKEVGFEVIENKSFCWIPHSAGRVLTSVLRALTPALDTVVPSHAMRSLVISRKRARS